jgi:hypothetical protein
MASNLPSQVVELMAQRPWRMHHYVWHSVRKSWQRFPEATKSALRDLGWEPPRPALQRLPDGSLQPIYDNDSGEDFLYMHREMIAAVNAELEEINDPAFPRVEPWHQIPRPNDPAFPVPPAWDTGNANLDANLDETKSTNFFNNRIRLWEDTYTDPMRLGTMSLGELGARIEFTIHNRMHMRWCSEPALGIRPDVDDARPDEIDEAWDDPAYDWLGDSYSSHVNPIFWKLHGWVDARIEDWKRANGVAGDIPWRGTWIGKMPSPTPDPLLPVVSTLLRRLLPDLFSVRADGARFPSRGHEASRHGHGHEHSHAASLAAAAKVILRSGVHCHFYDEVAGG